MGSIPFSKVIANNILKTIYSFPGLRTTLNRTGVRQMHFKSFSMPTTEKYRKDFPDQVVVVRFHRCSIGERETYTVFTETNLYLP